MTDSDLTHAILREIRDEIRATNTNLSAKIDATNERLDVTNERLEVTNERLTLVEHTVSDAAGQIVMLARYVKNKHETAIDELRERVTRLEAKSG